MAQCLLSRLVQSTLHKAGSQQRENTMATTVYDAMGEEYTNKIKGFASQYKVAIPEVVARLAIHALTDDNLDVADLLSDAPRSQRGRKPLDPEVKAAREAARKALTGKGAATPEESVKALMAAIDLLRRG